MPEFGDVEVLRRYVEATSLHRRIDDLFLRENLVEGVTPQTIRNCGAPGWMPRAGTASTCSSTPPRMAGSGFTSA